MTLRRAEQKVRDEKKAALKVKTFRVLGARLAAATERCRSDSVWSPRRSFCNGRCKQALDVMREFCALKEKDLRDQCVRFEKEIEERKTKESLDAALIDEIKDQIAKQITDLIAENTHLKVCAETSGADRDCVRVELHDTIEKNYQLQNQLQERMLEYQEQEKRNTELRFKLLEVQEITVREQENSELEHRVKELSGEVERTHVFQLERLLTCVSEASKDKDALKRLAGDDTST